MRPELQDVVDEVSRVVHGPVTLEDRGFNLVAFCPHGTTVDHVRQQSILQRRSTPRVRRWFEQYGIATSDRAVRIPASDEHGSLARACLPARWNDVTYGYLWLIDDGSVTGDTLTRAMALADRAGRVMAHQVRAREDVELLVQDLLSSHADTAEDAAVRVDELGLIRRGTPVAVVELRQAAGGRPWPGPMHLWTLPRTVLTRVGEDHATLVLPLPGGEVGPALELAHRARDLCLERFDDDRAAVDVVAGVGAPRPDLAHVRGSWQQARLAARIATGVPGIGPVADWAGLGVYRLLGAGADAALSEAVLDPAVRRLAGHEDADLVRTARVFLDRAGSVSATAAELNVHRQTVYHRLQRIETVTGLDLGSGRDRLTLHLGLTLAPLLPARP